MAKKQEVKFYMGNENLPSKGSTFAYTETEIKEFDKCTKNILHFAENYFFILKVGKGKEKIKLYKAQKRALKKMMENPYFVLLASRQIGKALALDTPIKTPNGWTTMGDLKVGDVVYGRDGNPCNVTHAYETRYDRPCYEVEFDNGEKIIADEDHNWFTQTKAERQRKSPCAGSVKTTLDIFNTLKSKAGEPNHRIPSCVNGLVNTEKDLIIPPYVLGVWLGDGNSCDSRITVGPRDIQEILTNLEAYNTHYKVSFKKYSNAYTVNLGMLSGRSGFRTETSLSEELRSFGLFGNKHIPDIYMNASREQRLELLKGLMDSDGYINKKGLATFYNTNLKLALQVKELIESLGYKTIYNTFIPTLNEIECAECAEIIFTPRELVCKLSFKSNRIKVDNITHPESSKRNQWHYIKNITAVQSVPVRCIEVDSSDHLFLAGKTCIPTHNSTLMTIYILWMANFFPDQRILLVANKESTAIEIFSRVRMAYELLPNWLKSPVVEYAKTSMELENGSRISITTTTGTAARGQAVSCLIVDECAFIEPHLMEPFWASVFPIVSSVVDAKVFMCSTPNGTGNLFYDIYTGAIESTNGWAHDKILWSEIPGRDEKWVKKIKSGLASEEKFRQEFECEFVNAGTGSLSEEVYNKLKSNLSDPIETLMDGKYKIFELYQEDKIYVAGVDTADGIGKDFSCIKILDITDPCEIIEAAEYYDNTTPVAEFANKVYEILCHWGKPIVCIERNNQGGQVADRLGIDMGYMDRVVSWGSKLAGRKNTQLLGMISSRNTKYNAVANARYYYSEKMALQFRNKDSLDEVCKDFVKLPNDSWGAVSGKHDDRTMALIWALMVLHDEIIDQYFTVDEVDDCGKPAKISRLPFGFTFEKATSIYTNEFVDGIENSFITPISFGTQSALTDDLADLEAEGWVYLNGSAYGDGYRELNDYETTFFDKYF